MLLVDSWAPWYPPSNTPKTAQIVSISENPLKGTMVYQTMEANHYLEGNVAVTLQLLTEALRKLGLDAATVAERRTRWQAEHKKWRDGIAAAEEKAAGKDAITIPLLMKTLREVMPKDTSYVDETIVHAGDIRDHIQMEDPHAYFRAPSGLGQGLGYALGVKLALPKRPVVMTIGDGRFLYNPVMPALTVSDEYKLPLLIIICNNKKYAIMEQLHNRFYPKGTAITTKDYYGVHINNSEIRARRRGRRRLRPAGRKACRSQKRNRGGTDLCRGRKTCDPQCDDAGFRCPTLGRQPRLPKQFDERPYSGAYTWFNPA